MKGSPVTVKCFDPKALIVENLENTSVQLGESVNFIGRFRLNAESRLSTVIRSTPFGEVIGQQL